MFNGENEYFFFSTGNRSQTPWHPIRTRSPLSYATYNLFTELKIRAERTFKGLRYLDSDHFHLFL